jgi:hypothetical protein
VELNEQSTFPPKVVTIVTKDGARKELVFSATAEEIIKEIGIHMDLNDMVKPDDHQVVANNGVVQVVKVDIEILTRTESVPFDTEEVETEALTTGSVQVKQKGAEGLREKIIKIIHEDGRVVKSEIVASDIVKKPIQQILLIGTKPVTVAGCDYWGAVVDRLISDPKERHWMKFMMYAESGCDSGKVSRGSGAYKGLFQFSPTTFYRKSVGNIWDGTEQIRVVDAMYNSVSESNRSEYLSGQWPHYHRVYLEKYGDQFGW